MNKKLNKKIYMGLATIALLAPMALHNTLVNADANTSNVQMGQSNRSNQTNQSAQPNDSRNNNYPASPSNGGSQNITFPPAPTNYASNPNNRNISKRLAQDKSHINQAIERLKKVQHKVRTTKAKKFSNKPNKALKNAEKLVGHAQAQYDHDDKIEWYSIQ